MVQLWDLSFFLLTFPPVPRCFLMQMPRASGNGVGVLVTLLIGCGDIFFATRNLTPAAYADVKEWSIDYWVCNSDGLLTWLRWKAQRLRLLHVDMWDEAMTPQDEITLLINSLHLSLSQYLASCRCHGVDFTEVVIRTNMGYTYRHNLLAVCFIVWLIHPTFARNSIASQAGRFWQCHNCSWHLHPVLTGKGWFLRPFQCAYQVVG